MKKSCLRRFYLRYVFVGVCLFISVLAIAKPPAGCSKLSKNLEILAHVLKELATHYAGKINYEELLHTGIHAMLQSLDPYTSFIPDRKSVV